MDEGDRASATADGTRPKRGRLAWLQGLRARIIGLVLVSVLTAVGASALLVELLGLQVSALGALSGPLVVAICTEFSVLIVERYTEERRAGRSPDEALAIASLRTGRAFSASGLTVAGGFAALAVSGFPLLTTFGIIVALNILVSLVVALVLLPPLLTWGERPAGVSDAGRDQHPPTPAASTEPLRRARATDGASVASRN